MGFANASFPSRLGVPQCRSCTARSRSAPSRCCSLLHPPPRSPRRSTRPRAEARSRSARRHLVLGDAVPLSAQLLPGRSATSTSTSICLGAAAASTSPWARARPARCGARSGRARPAPVRPAAPAPSSPTATASRRPTSRSPSAGKTTVEFAGTGADGEPLVQSVTVDVGGDATGDGGDDAPDDTDRPRRGRNPVEHRRQRAHRDRRRRPRPARRRRVCWCSRCAVVATPRTSPDVLTT